MVYFTHGPLSLSVVFLIRWLLSFALSDLVHALARRKNAFVARVRCALVLARGLVHHRGSEAASRGPLWASKEQQQQTQRPKGPPVPGNAPLPQHQSKITAFFTLTQSPHVRVTRAGVIVHPEHHTRASTACRRSVMRNELRSTPDCPGRSVTYTTARGTDYVTMRFCPSLIRAGHLLLCVASQHAPTAHTCSVPVQAVRQPAAGIFERSLCVCARGRGLGATAANPGR